MSGGVQSAVSDLLEAFRAGEGVDLVRESRWSTEVPSEHRSVDDFVYTTYHRVHDQDDDDQGQP